MFFVALSVAQQRSGVTPGWAFPVADKDEPAVSEASEARQMPGSPKSYTPAQIDDLLNPPDWFPEEHGPRRLASNRSALTDISVSSCSISGKLVFLCGSNAGLEYHRLEGSGRIFIVLYVAENVTLPPAR